MIMATIKLNHLTKVEGHANLHIKVEDGKVEKVEMQDIEGARYFEALLRGHHWTEAQMITSRICGICSGAHTLASVQATERALGIIPTEQTKKLRRLFTIGESIRSHAAHLYLLALPDYLGYESALALPPKFKKEVGIALNLIKLGNDICRTLGGKEMHPFKILPGGFSKLPTQDELKELGVRIKKAMPDAMTTAKLFLSLPYPKLERVAENCCLAAKGEYPLHDGVVRSHTEDFNQKDYHKHIIEDLELAYSTSKLARKNSGSFRVGALARLNNNMEQLTPQAKKLAKGSKLFPSNNPFYHLVAQGIELVWNIEEGEELCKMKLKDEKPIDVEATRKLGRGISCVEAPRGLVWHEYEYDKDGRITYANIITPTAQNNRAIEDDVKAFLPGLLSLPEDKLKLEVEKLIRAYDPCYSCSAHFLTITWEK
jgi:sulfhydrogenase subunit alpha